MRFPGSLIFNGLQSLKMAVYPYIVHRPSKNGVFQQPVSRAALQQLHQRNMSVGGVWVVLFDAVAFRILLM